jgi:hypothetical protein
MNEDIKRLVEELRSSEHRQPINPKAVYRTRDVALFEEAANALERLSKEANPHG